MVKRGETAKKCKDRKKKSAKTAKKVPKPLTSIICDMRANESPGKKNLFKLKTAGRPAGRTDGHIDIMTY